MGTCPARCLAQWHVAPSGTAAAPRQSPAASAKVSPAPPSRLSTPRGRHYSLGVAARRSSVTPPPHLVNTESVCLLSTAVAYIQGEQGHIHLSCWPGKIGRSYVSLGVLLLWVCVRVLHQASRQV